MDFRKAAFVIGSAALLAGSAPTIAQGVARAQEVIVGNGDDRPVPTKAIGTTTVAGAVQVPGGVAITGTPTVQLADGQVVTAKAAPPERYQRRLAALNTSTIQAEVCEPIVVPAGKRLVLDSSLWELARTGGDGTPRAHLTVATSNGATSFDRFAPETLATTDTGTTGRLEGPIVLDGTTSGSVCARPQTRAETVLTGTLEPAS